ncbi:MAG: HEAT repeat domain-containing protein [Gemmataceae bacterium]
MAKSFEKGDAQERRAALKKILRSRAAIKTALPGLMETAKHPEDELYDDALIALSHCYYDAKKVAPLLLAAIEGKATTRIHLLGRLGPDAGAVAVAPLWKLFRETKDDELRGVIADTLAHLGPVALPALRKILGDKRWQTKALESLAHGRTEAAGLVPEVVRILQKSADASTRLAAARLLARVGPSAESAVPALRRMLADPDSRADAARALEAIGPAAREAAPDLIAALDAEWEKRAKPAGRKDFFGGTRPSPVLHDVARALQVIDSSSAKALARTLAKHVARLSKELDSDEAKVVDAALADLADMGPAARDAIPSLEPLLKATSRRRRIDAASTIASIDPENAAAFATLRATLKDPLADHRAEAAYRLGRLGVFAKSAVPELTTALRDGDAETRRLAAEALGPMGPEAAAAVPELRRLCGEEDARTRLAAAESLGLIGNKKATPALQALYQDSRDPKEKLALAIALLRLDPDCPQIEEEGAKWGRALARILDTERDHDMLAVIVLGIAPLAPRLKDSEPSLLEAMNDPAHSGGAVLAGMALLAHPGHELARTKIVQHLPDYLALLQTPPDLAVAKSENYRAFAARVLGAVGPAAQDAIPALERATRDEHHQVRAAAEQALRRIRDK